MSRYWSLHRDKYLPEGEHYQFIFHISSFNFAFISSSFVSVQGTFVDQVDPFETEAEGLASKTVHVPVLYSLSVVVIIVIFLCVLFAG